MQTAQMHIVRSHNFATETLNIDETVGGPIKQPCLLLQAGSEAKFC